MTDVATYSETENVNKVRAGLLGNPGYLSGGIMPTPLTFKDGVPPMAAKNAMKGYGKEPSCTILDTWVNRRPAGGGMTK